MDERGRLRFTRRVLLSAVKGCNLVTCHSCLSHGDIRLHWRPDAFLQARWAILDMDSDKRTRPRTIPVLFSNFKIHLNGLFSVSVYVWSFLIFEVLQFLALKPLSVAQKVLLSAHSPTSIQGCWFL